MEHAESRLPTRRVGQTGTDICVLGFGGASVGNLYRESSDDVARAAVEAARDLGVRYFDTAPYYGHGLSEVRFGKFLGQGAQAAGITLSTKVGRVLDPVEPDETPDHGFINPLPFRPMFDYSRDGIMRSFRESCVRLGTDYIDILYMHDIGAMTHGADAHPGLFRQAMEEGFPAMAELRREGRVGAIGLGVNEWEVCHESFAHADFDVFMLAGRYTLLEQEPLKTFLPECERRGVSVVCASPFNSGLMARRPDAQSRYNYAEAPDALIERASRVFDICDAHGVSAQSAALHFPLLHPAVVSVVNGMSTADRVAGTLAWFDEAIPAGLWADLKTEGILQPDAPVGDEGTTHAH